MAIPLKPRVGLLIESSSGAGRQMLQGVSQFARALSEWSVYFQMGGTDEAIRNWLAEAPEGGIHGIIGRFRGRAAAEAVAKAGVVAVDVLGGSEGVGLPILHVDDAAVGALGAEHLLELGLSSFGYFGLSDAYWSGVRHRSFERTLARAGYPCQALIVRAQPQGPVGWLRQERKLERWLRSLPKPCGVMGCYDASAFQVLEVCRRAGLRVPDEVAVIGVDDDNPFCELATPALSSIDANHVTVGYRAAALLDELLRTAKRRTLRRRRAPVIEIPPAGVRVRRSTEVTAVNEPLVARAIAFIRDHACRGIDVSDVVEASRASQSTLQRRFRAVLGRTIHEELERHRLREACRLLTATNLTIRRIAAQCGYRDPDYFSVAFRGRMGCTPGEYRRVRGG